jgi:hypothetical protein
LFLICLNLYARWESNPQPLAPEVRVVTITPYHNLLYIFMLQNALFFVFVKSSLFYITFFHLQFHSFVDCFEQLSKQSEYGTTKKSEQ